MILLQYATSTSPEDLLSNTQYIGTSSIPVVLTIYTKAKAAHLWEDWIGQMTFDLWFSKEL